MYHSLDFTCLYELKDETDVLLQDSMETASCKSDENEGNSSSNADDPAPDVQDIKVNDSSENSQSQSTDGDHGEANVSH